MSTAGRHGRGSRKPSPAVAARVAGACGGRRRSATLPSHGARTVTGPVGGAEGVVRRIWDRGRCRQERGAAGPRAPDRLATAAGGGEPGRLDTAVGKGRQEPRSPGPGMAPDAAGLRPLQRPARAVRAPQGRVTRSKTERGRGIPGRDRMREPNASPVKGKQSPGRRFRTASGARHGPTGPQHPRRAVLAEVARGHALTPREAGPGTGVAESGTDEWVCCGFSAGRPAHARPGRPADALSDCRITPGARAEAGRT